MPTNREVITKSVTSDAFGSAPNYAGRLNNEQADKFITLLVDQSAFLKDIRTERMTTPTKDLDFLGIGSRLIRKATEATAPSDVATATLTKKQLTSVEIILPADISQTFLEDNIERGGADDTISAMLAKQYANDLTDLAINGDTEDNGSDKAFLNIDDGLLKIAKASASTHKFDTDAGTDYKGVVFPGMLALLTEKWKSNVGELRFYVAPSVAEAYIQSLASRQTALGDDIMTGGRLPQYMGIDIFKVPYLPAGTMILTPRKNIAFGIQRDFNVAREFIPRKRIYEYTMTSRGDACQIVIDDALVIAYNVG